MKWEVEGGKELLWVAIKKVCAKERLLVCESKRLSSTVKKFSVKENLLVCGKGRFSAHAKLSDKEKIFSAHNDTDFAPQQN